MSFIRHDHLPCQQAEFQEKFSGLWVLQSIYQGQPEAFSSAMMITHGFDGMACLLEKWFLMQVHWQHLNIFLIVRDNRRITEVTSDDEWEQIRRYQHRAPPSPHHQLQQHYRGISYMQRQQLLRVNASIHLYQKSRRTETRNHPIFKLHCCPDYKSINNGCRTIATLAKILIGLRPKNKKLRQWFSSVGSAVIFRTLEGTLRVG